MALSVISRRLRLFFPPVVRFSPSSAGGDDASDFDISPDDPTCPAGDAVALLVSLVSSTMSETSSRAQALTLLRRRSPGAAPAEGILLRALWELRRDPEAALLALRWDEERAGGVDCPQAWHLAIWAAGKAGRFDLAWCAVRRMHKWSALTPRAMVIMMERYAAANEVSKAIKTFNVLEKFKLHQDSTIYYSLLRALCKNGYIEEAEEVFLLKKKFFPLSVEGFNIILDGWCNIITDVVEAKRVWREMSACCIIPDGTSYAHMISCFSKCGNLFESLRLFDEMKRRGRSCDVGVYNSLIYVLTKKNCLKEAQKVIAIISDEGLQLNRETYNCMIVALCQTHRLDEARDMLDDMLAKGVTPNIQTYHALLKQEYVDGSLMRLKQMKEAKCGPDKDTFLLLTEKFFRLNESSNALRMWSEMKVYGVEPDSSLYLTMVQGLVKCGWIPKALQFYEEMTQKGFSGDPMLKKFFKAFLSVNKNHWGEVGKKYIVPRTARHQGSAESPIAMNTEF